MANGNVLLIAGISVPVSRTQNSSMTSFPPPTSIFQGNWNAAWVLHQEGQFSDKGQYLRG